MNHTNPTSLIHWRGVLGSFNGRKMEVQMYLKRKFSIKPLFASVVTAVALLAGGHAQADPVSFIPGGDVKFKYENFETFVSVSTPVLNGIFNVTSIGPLFGSPYWASTISD